MAAFGPSSIPKSPRAWTRWRVRQSSCAARAMAESRTRRPRDPEATREAILEAARTQLAKDGPEGLSLSEVAHLAGVNRGTAYQHFRTREKLIEATPDWVQDRCV